MEFKGKTGLEWYWLVIVDTLLVEEFWTGKLLTKKYRSKTSEFSALQLIV
jgi:hypothetical protein